MQQILVDHISKSFGDTVIFRNTSLTIQKGHVVGIIEIGRASCRERVSLHVYL